MPNIRRPKRGSHGYSPRVRAQSQVPRWSSWPEDAGEPHVQGFAAYKAGMTHALLVDYRKSSTTAGQEVQVPATVLECPPMRVAAVRFYELTSAGWKTLSEVWAPDVDKRLSERVSVPKERSGSFDGVVLDDAEEVRLLAYTQPAKVTGVPKKVPEIMELRVGGGAFDARVAFAKGLLGKELAVKDVFKNGQMLDVAAITKGHGFKGSVPRWGVKLQGHKDSKNRRDTSPLGPFQPRFIRPTVPMPGQMGYHQRTEYNKRILKVGEEGAEITPAGGFLHYGVVRNHYLLLHGSIPGPTKRLVRLREAARDHGHVKVEQPDLTYISTASKQGV